MANIDRTCDLGDRRAGVHDMGEEAQMSKILKDGTLCVTVNDFQKVKRVLVQDNYCFGGLYYPDEEPIVRCKDCKYYLQKQKDKPWDCGRRYCNHGALKATDPNDFCSWGRKGTDDED